MKGMRGAVFWIALKI